MKSKIWAIVFITLSYLFTYFVPIVLLYFALKDKFIVDYVVKSHYSVYFLGFMTVSSILFIALMVRVLRNLHKAKASIVKHVTFGLIYVLIISFVAYLILMLSDFTHVIEKDTVKFFIQFRAFLSTTVNYIMIFAICLLLSTLSNIAAIKIDKEFVRSIEWL